MSEEFLFETKYENKIDILNFIKTDKFFYKVKEKLDVTEFKFIPKIEDNLFSSKYIKWPQSISYDTNFSVIGYSLPGLNFTQTFDLNYDVLYCNTQVKSCEIAEFDILFKITFIENDNKVKLKVVFDKPTDIYIPNFVYNILSERLANTLEKIFN